MPIHEQQAQRLGVDPYTQLSPVFAKCCLRVGANTSYQKAEAEIEALTGVPVSRSTIQRLGQRTEFEWPDAKQSVPEVSVDGGKVRVRTDEVGQESQWLEYKSARVSGIYYGASFKDNALLTSWLNSQPLEQILTCLGDGHDGVWNVFAEVGDPHQRLEILDWYHLKENLFGVGGSIARLHVAEEHLWHGRVDEVLKVFAACTTEAARKFRGYLEKQRHRIVNYSYLQAEGITVGSGAVESAIKQIDARLKLPGAQWKFENVPQMLQLRCAYLNGLLEV